MNHLYKYGIEEEKSDIRAHVCLPGRCVTVYRTADMVSLLARKAYPTAFAKQPGVDFATGFGWKVPIADIEPKYILTSPIYRWDQWDHDAMGPGAKGDMAVACVRDFIVSNKFPLWVCGVVNSDKELDIKGTDIVVSANRRIQVKYDWRACSKASHPMGTGNLFIQSHECNPLKIRGKAEVELAVPF